MPSGRRATPLQMSCQNCGTGFETWAVQPALYCTPLCRRKAANTRRPNGYQRTRDKVCEWCSAEFRGRPESRYCGRSCLARAGWASKRLKPQPRTADRWDTKLRMNYGIGRAEYEALLEVQGGGCAICGDPLRDIKTGRRLCVDHCHDTGKVRGLLCGHCNRGLGFFGDSMERLERAIRYLAPHA